MRGRDGGNESCACMSTGRAVKEESLTSSTQRSVGE